jgi:nicotinate-nucleotide adenylyltransferase
MGGTFDPLHYGHLVIAEETRRLIGLDEVLFIPARQPPHKVDRVVSAPEHRYAMTLLGIAGYAPFRASRIEIERQGPSYTIDTVREIGRQESDAEIFFITGADAILEILQWHRHDELLSSCRFIAATRPGYPMKRLEALPLPTQARITPVSVPGIDISSSMIRARVAQGHSVRFLVPDCVEVYIAQHGLYRAPGEAPAA